MDYALNRGERVLWTGAPPQGMRFTAADLIVVPFSLFWTGFAVLWEWLALTTGAPAYFPLFGIPFVLIGVYLLVGRFFSDASARARTEYAITSERAIIVRRNRIASFDLSGLTGHSADEKADGTGTIWLTMRPMVTMGRAPSGFPSRYITTPSFESIPDVRRVYGILVDAQRRRVAAPLESPA